MAEICKTDLQKIISYLNEAAELYDALPMQTIQMNDEKVNLLKICRVRPGYGAGKCSCRAHMIKQLINKLKNKLQNDKK